MASDNKVELVVEFQFQPGQVGLWEVLQPQMIELVVSVPPAQLDALPPGSGGSNFVRTPAEIAFMSAAIGSLNSADDLCGFPDATLDMDVASIRMISDTRLLPNLETSPLSPKSGKCAGSGAFAFIAKPLLSMAEVRQAYGKPQTERKDADGSELLTYGRVRIQGAKDGQAALVLLRPSNH